MSADRGSAQARHSEAASRKGRSHPLRACRFGTQACLPTAEHAFDGAIPVRFDSAPFRYRGREREQGGVVDMNAQRGAALIMWMFIVLLVPIRALLPRFFKEDDLAFLDADEEPDSEELHWV